MISKFLIILFLGVTVWAIPVRSHSLNYPEQLNQLHRNIVAHIFQSPANDKRVEVLLETITSKGIWPGINYSSQERGAWEPRTHISNLLQIAKAYQTAESKCYQDKEVLAKFHAAFDFWMENDFICPNWWFPEIGVPMVLAPVMILMEPELSDRQMQQGINILNRSKIGMTGQNKVWLSGNVLMKALLQKDVETIAKATNSIQEELVVSTGEGVQPDWSYHQHGPQLQFGNYGLSYVGDMIQWISILRNTPFQFDESKLEILRNYLLEGQQWVMWKQMYDISACGRQLFPNAQQSKASSLSGSFAKMEKVDPSFANDYRKANNYSTLSGNRHFWRSDFQVQRNPNYYFSVKMCSQRVIGAESCNSENLQGYYMGDGATFLYQTQKEYEDIFPFWDWKKIPGTTVHQDNEVLPVLTASGYRTESHFVGGVSSGQNGIAAMSYIRNGLEAKKSWFMFNDLIICLGAGITSTKGLPVTTSVNQSFLNGAPVVKAASGNFANGETQTLTNPKWILHDNIGYIFPEEGTLNLETKAVDGSWHWVASRYPEDIMQRDVFKLWFDHGRNPKAGSYQYMLVPNATRQRMVELENQQFVKIYNEKDRQEVVSVDSNWAGIVFHEPGKSSAIGGIEVNNPCVVMLKVQETEVLLFIADPTQRLNEIAIRFDDVFDGESLTHTNGQTQLKIVLPQGEEAGKSVTYKLVRR